MSTTTTDRPAVVLPARNRTRKDGGADRRYALGPTAVRWYVVREAGETLGEVEANTPIGALGRLALHLGVPMADARDRWTVEEA